MMSAVQSKNTRLELLVRSGLHRAGFRFRLHVRGLPGVPDIVFPSRKKVIFVNGCFWHAHKCENMRWPKSNLGYWLPKLSRNRKRDRLNLAKLKRMGWDCMTLWECELSDCAKALRRASQFLRRSNPRL